MEIIESLIESLLACNIKDVFTLSNDSLIDILAAFEKSNFNIHCLYSEENIPIAAGACATYTGNTTVVLLSDGFSVNKSINSLIATRIKYCPVLCIIIDNNQDSALALKENNVESLKTDPFLAKYGFQQINPNLLNQPSNMIAHLKQIHIKNVPHLLRIRLSSNIYPTPIPPLMRQKRDIIHYLKRLLPNQSDHSSIQPTINDFIANKHAIAILGNQIHKSNDQANVRRLLQALQIPYASLPSTKSFVPENNEMYLGTYYGNLSSSYLIHHLRDVTHILKIGVEDYPYDFYQSDKYLVEVTRCLNPTFFSINADYFFLDQQIEENKFLSNPINGDVYDRQLLNSTDQEILDRITYTLSLPSFCPKVIVADVGVTCLSSLGIRLGPTDAYFSNHASASMGLSLASACGISIAKPSTPVWILIGDGSLLMALSDLVFLANLKNNINILLLDNQQYLTENLRYKTKHHSTPPINWESLSKSLGIDHFFRVNTQEQAETCLIESSNLPNTTFIQICLNNKNKFDSTILGSLNFLDK
ncbi:thiamine pyrophosphate-dependent enzyme [Synechococcus sp. MU1625]|uniref:thiamine pyrophosphate-dependent enzyme n=1 Tax=Synechococcus sp. MU1625 TaxID=2508347 RepID=UPI001CF82AFA|nr:thiamine pyrophosphate-dependent enzyme [Synechococcus sp. MU1625]MCB4399378.1 hypothetical protein [Synechococcus sp. MU1625]